MKDPTHVLVQALYNELNGNVSYSGSTIPVYTRIVEWDDLVNSSTLFAAVIQLAGIRMTEIGPKDRYMVEGSGEIYVDTYFTGKDEGSQVPVNAISSSICQLIDKEMTLSGYSHTVGRIQDLELLEYDLDDGGAMFRKTITYQFIIEEL